MKKIYLLAAFFGFATIANAQTAASTITPSDKGGVIINKQPRLLDKKQSANRSGNTRWYNYGETMDKYMETFIGVNSTLYGNNVFPDTTILVNYGASGFSGPWIHNLGDVLDINSAQFNDATLHPGELYLDKTMPYRVDSVGMLFIYRRNNPDPSIVDTLIIEVGVNVNTSTYSYAATSTVGQNLGDTVMFKAIPYNYTTNTMTYANKKTYKIPLDLAFYEDSTADGFHYAEVSTANLANVIPGRLVTMSAKFKPGYAWNANQDLLADNNGVFFLSFKEQEEMFPMYTQGDFNVSYILPQDVRYNNAGSYNGMFIPSFAYMGDLPTYSYEHHLFYYLVNSQLTGVEKASDSKTTLFQNEPNPFSKTTTIRYSLDKTDNVSLSIIDVTGRVVKTITESNVGAGNHAVTIDASEFNKGVYFYTLKTGGKSFTKRMIIAD